MYIGAYNIIYIYIYIYWHTTPNAHEIWMNFKVYWLNARSLTSFTGLLNVRRLCVCVLRFENVVFESYLWECSLFKSGFGAVCLVWDGSSDIPAGNLCVCHSVSGSNDDFATATGAQVGTHFCYVISCHVCLGILGQNNDFPTPMTSICHILTLLCACSWESHVLHVSLCVCVCVLRSR
jgi:hypothetical protein